MPWKIPGHLCFSGQAQVAQKSWMIKIFQYSENFQGNSGFQGKCKLLKNPECKRYIQYGGKFQGNSVFSGQAQVAQKSWYSLGGNPCNLG